MPIFIHANESSIDALMVRSLSGKMVDYLKVQPTDVITLPTNALAPGTYILQLYDRSGSILHAVFFVQ